MIAPQEQELLDSSTPLERNFHFNLKLPRAQKLPHLCEPKEMGRDLQNQECLQQNHWPPRAEGRHMRKRRIAILRRISILRVLTCRTTNHAWTEDNICASVTDYRPGGATKPSSQRPKIRNVKPQLRLHRRMGFASQRARLLKCPS